MSSNLLDALGRPIVPLDPGAEPYRQLISGRRKRLQVHNPNAINFAANIQKARYDLANGETPKLKCEETDPDAKFRRLQLTGAKSYRVEDGTAVCLEHERGQDVEIAAARKFLFTVAAFAPEKVRALHSELGAFLGEPPAADLALVVARANRADGESNAVFAESVSPTSPGGSAITLPEITRLKAVFAAKRQASEDAEAAVRRAEIQFSTKEGA